MGIARIFLKSELVQQYYSKNIEFETPNRRYCYFAICTAIINGCVLCLGRIMFGKETPAEQISPAIKSMI